MFRKILVPLDGSKLAECSLTYAEELAQRCAIEELVLVSVTERVRGYQPVRDLSQPTEQRFVPEAVGKKETQAQKYLGRITKDLVKKEIKVRIEVLLGDPAEEIVNFAKYHNIDLIVMASHGRSGPSRWTHGSVADRVFRASCVPVLMVRAPGCLPGV